METIKGVRIDSQTLVVNSMTESDVIRTQVQGIIQGARVVNTKYLSDGAVEVAVEIPLTGSLTSFRKSSEGVTRSKGKRPLSLKSLRAARCVSLFRDAVQSLNTRV